MLISFSACAKNTTEKKEQKIEKTFDVKVVLDKIKKATEYTPDAFNMKSARVVVALGEKQNELWDKIFDAFGGKVPREKEKEEISNRVRIIK